jgi:hypothetical protein
MKLLILALFFSTNALASTKFIWIQKDPLKLETGLCLEVDKNLDTSNFYKVEQFSYAKKVSATKCKPSDKEISYIFSPRTGRCFEGDSKTSGKKYFVSANLKYCKTENVEFKRMTINETFACFEIDTKSKGSNYYKKVLAKYCIDEDSSFVWVPYNERSGRCYSVNPETMKRLKTKKEKCRPAKPIFRFKRTGPFKGLCIEKSRYPNNAYSMSVKDENCRTENTSFFFYKKPGELNGKCYELDTESKGDAYISRVESEQCKN